MPRRIPLFTLALAVVAITVTPAVRTAGQGDGPWRIRKFAPDQLRQWNRELARMERAGDLKLVRVQQDTLVPGPSSSQSWATRSGSR